MYPEICLHGDASLGKKILLLLFLIGQRRLKRTGIITEPFFTNRCKRVSSSVLHLFTAINEQLRNKHKMLSPV